MAADKKKVVLFVNAGTTDLQVIINEQHRNGEMGEKLRTEVSNANLRGFHQYLLDNPSCYKVNEEFPLLKKSGNFKVKWKSEKNGVQGYLVVTDKNDKELEDKSASIEQQEPEFQYILVPAKLAGVADWLRSPDKYETEKGDYQKYYDCEVKKVVVFYTHRDKGEKEPIAVGDVLSKWLQSTLSPSQDNLIEAIPVNILSSGRLEGEGPKYPVNPTTVNMINDKIREIAVADTQWIACVSVGGGMNDLKPLIKSCARFHFSADRYFELEVKEERDTTPYFSDKYVPISVDSFRAREHAVELIKQGDFAGAYAAVRHLASDSAEEEWVKPVQLVSDYFSGMLLESSFADYKGTLLDKVLSTDQAKKPRCLLVGMRVESALRLGQISKAIDLTCTFFDAALHDAIENHPGVEVLDEYNKKITFADQSSLLAEIHRLQAINQIDVFKSHTGNTYEYLAFNKALSERWAQALKIDALKVYVGKMDIKDRTSNWKPRDLRNTNIHSLIPDTLLKQAIGVFNYADLWGIVSLDKPYSEHKGCFLGAPVPKAVLMHFIQEQPLDIYNSLVRDLVKILKDYEIK